MKIGLSLFAVAAAALLAVGCGGDKGGGEDEANYDGWMLTRWKDGTALTGTVYLQLGEDGIFSLYQSIGTFGYARFTGTYALVGDPATGQVLRGPMPTVRRGAAAMRLKKCRSGNCGSAR